MYNYVRFKRVCGQVYKVFQEHRTELHDYAVLI